MRPTHVLALMAVVAAASSATIGNRDPVVDHVQRVMEFPCAVPQERAVPAVEVVQRRVSTNQTLWPPVTVLRRCDAGSGCCLLAGFTCTAVEFQNVTLYFELRTPPTPGVKVKREVIDEVVLEHKRCACKPPPTDDAH